MKIPTEALTLICFNAVVISKCAAVSSRRLGEQNTTTAPGYVDLSPLLQEIQEGGGGLVGIAAFVSSSTGVCAAGSAGHLAASAPAAPAAGGSSNPAAVGSVRSVPDSPPPVAPISLWSSPWHGGSLTKSMTASLAALLVTDPSVPLGWDTTLGEVLPVEAGSSPYANVTLAQILSHQGGFPRDVTNVEEEVDDEFLSLSLMDQRRTALLYGLASEPVARRGQYSNVGYMVAGALMENVTGVAWEDLITERLFSPLGMSSAYFGCPDAPLSHTPLGHWYDNETGSLKPIPATSWCDCIGMNMTECFCGLPPVMGPAGTVHMQVSDYVRYYQWHLAGHWGEDTSGLLPTEEFRRLHTSMGIFHDDASNQTLPVALDYGYGWMMLPGEEHTITHSGSTGKWYANVVISLEDDRVYFFATNSVTTKTGELPYGLNDLLSRMMTTTYNDSACPPVDTLDVDRVVGSHEQCVENMYGAPVSTTSTPGPTTTASEPSVDNDTSSNSVDDSTSSSSGLRIVAGVPFLLLLLSVYSLLLLH